MPRGKRRRWVGQDGARGRGSLESFDCRQVVHCDCPSTVCAGTIDESPHLRGNSIELTSLDRNIVLQLPGR